MTDTEKTPQVQVDESQLGGNTRTVELDHPVTRGKERISQVTIIKPKSGSLRGVSLHDLLQMDVQALTKVLPRISQPTLTEAELRDLDPADLLQLGTAVGEFFLPKRMRDDLPE